MKIQMISTQPHLYAGKRLKVGESFEAAGRGDARLLIALGRAVEAPLPQAAEPAAAPEPAARPKRSYTRRVVTAAPEPAAAEPPPAQPSAPAEPHESTTGRTYTRRDLEAET